LEPHITDALLHIPGFTLYRNDRQAGKGGGVCFYVAEVLRVLSPTPSSTVEALLLKIVDRNKKPQSLLVGCVYRPPSAPVSFWEQLETFIDDCMRIMKGQLILLGDFNVDVLQSNARISNHYHHLHHMCQSLHIRNTIISPTRIPSNTCLDLILLPVSLPTDMSWNTNVRSLSGITDHHLVSVELTFTGADITHPLSTTRSIRKPGIHQLRPDAFSSDFTKALNGHTIPSMGLSNYTDFWCKSVVKVLDDHCPEHLVPVFNHPSPRPWVTPHLKHILEQRKHKHNRWLKDSTNDQLRQDYRAVRREGTNLNRRLREKYFKNQLYLHKSNPRAQWKIINQLLGRNPLQGVLPVDPLALTNTFSAIIDPPSGTDTVVVPYGPHHLESFMTFHTVSTSTISDMLQRSSSSKASGLDGIPASILKNHSHCLAHSLSAICNESLTSGIFPLPFKVARVRPIHKKGDPTDPRNYRPVSILPLASKILERIVHLQLTTFIHDNPATLPAEQFAYRRGHSCEDALALCVDRWQRSVDGGDVVAVAFLDLTKAFDSVCHDKLILELFSCGIGGTALAWFADYLQGRTQQVVCPRSAPGPIFHCKKGVPQGSVLGPLLFSLYTRRVPNAIRRSACQLFADDTCLYAAHPTITTAISYLESDIRALTTFFSQHGLHLNPAKTKFLLIRKPTISIPLNCTLTVDSTQISPITKAKYLGVTIDEHLTFKHQVDSLRQRIGHKLSCFRRCNSLMTFQAIAFLSPLLTT